MKNKKTLLSIVLVFAVLMGGAYVLYDRLGRNVGTEQMIVHTDQQPAGIGGHRRRFGRSGRGRRGRVRAGARGRFRARFYGV